MIKLMIKNKIIIIFNNKNNLNKVSLINHKYLRFILKIKYY